MANPLAPIGKPPMFDSDVGDYTWKGWFNSITTQFFNNDNPNAVVTKSQSLGTGFLIPCNTTSGSITLTLPKASLAKGKKYLIKKITGDGNTVTINPFSGDTIESNTTWILTATDSYIELISDGSLTWYIEGTSIGSTSSQRNLVINGNFRVWQRGLSFADPGTTYYGPDRWAGSSGTAGRSTIVQDNSSGLLNYPYVMRITRSATDTNTASIYGATSFESIDAQQIAGKQCSWSFWIRCGAGFSFTSGIYPNSQAMEFSVQSGTGTDIGPFGAMGTYVGRTFYTPTTTWQRFSGTGFFPTNTNCFKVFISWQPGAVAGANNYVELTGVQLTLGGQDADPMYETFTETLQKCMRYYRKSFPYGTPPAVNAGTAGAVAHRVEASPSTVQSGNMVQFDPPLRYAGLSPSLYSPGAANNNWWDETALINTIVPSILHQGPTGMYISRPVIPAGASVNDVISIHYSIDAELY